MIWGHLDKNTIGLTKPNRAFKEIDFTILIRVFEREYEVFVSYGFAEESVFIPIEYLFEAFKSGWAEIVRHTLGRSASCESVTHKVCFSLVTVRTYCPDIVRIVVEGVSIFVVSL
jgi:hypothetical protein